MSITNVQLSLKSWKIKKYENCKWKIPLGCRELHVRSFFLRKVVTVHEWQWLIIRNKTPRLKLTVILNSKPLTKIHDLILLKYFIQKKYNETPLLSISKNSWCIIATNKDTLDQPKVDRKISDPPKRRSIPWLARSVHSRRNNPHERTSCANRGSWWEFGTPFIRWRTRRIEVRDNVDTFTRFRVSAAISWSSLVPDNPWVRNHRFARSALIECVCILTTLYASSRDLPGRGR